MAWLLGSMLLAAALTPWLYQGGKGLAALTAERDLPAVVEWLGASCGRAKLGRYFDRSLLIAALLLLPVLWRRIRRIGSGSTRHGLRRIGWRAGLVQAATAMVVAAGILGGLCLIIAWAGAIETKSAAPSAGRLVSRALLPAVGASVVEEWLFRGLLLGLWLRFAKPPGAAAGSALLFAFLHFLKPPPGRIIADPSHPLAGFELLGGVLLHYTDPQFLLVDFGVLVGVGCVLAWSRLRTGALWFPIGLHAGWIMVVKICNLLCERVPDHPLRPWWVGDSLRSGLLPLLTLLVTAGVSGLVLPRLPGVSSKPSVETGG